jgi:flagellar biosynthesis protein FliR
MTVTVLPEVTVLFLLLFARLGAMVMLMPALGEQAVPVRVRLSIALLLTLIFYPTISTQLPTGLSRDVPAMLFLMGSEILIGLSFGLLARILLSATQVAGTSIATAIGLGFSQSIDPTMGQQGAIISSFLNVLGMMLIFASDFHHMAIIGIADSYTMFPPGEMLPLADFKDAAVGTIAESFKIGIQLSSPFIVFGLVFNVGVGILTKLMPQLQVFFLAQPLTIVGGLILFALVLGTMMSLYLGHVHDGLIRFVIP